jgi:hypothetical protein
MKWFLRILSLCTLAYSARGGDMVVVSTLGDSNGADAAWEWVVPRERFSDPRNAWNADSGEFPIDLSRYCGIARSNVMVLHRWSSTPEVALVHIRQISAFVNSNDASIPPLQRTVVSFHFREPGTAPALGPVRPVIMLLDGTIATMRRRSGR